MTTLSLSIISPYVYLYNNNFVNPNLTMKLFVDNWEGSHLKGRSGNESSGKIIKFS